MKYILIIADGMADYPVKKFNGKTPLQVAKHPNMDMIASKGVCGMMKTIPENMDTGSEVAILSIFGYDPRKYFTGRGPLEAVAANIDLSPHEIALRCNLITEKDGFLKDYSAGHIETSEATQLINTLKRVYEKQNEIRFYIGVGYRHILVLNGEEYSDRLECTPPHDAVGRRIFDILIKPKTEYAVKTAFLLNNLMLESRKILLRHPVNLQREKNHINVANMIWLWSPGRKPKLPNFLEKYGLKGAVISAVNIVKGIGIYAGMTIIDVPGATGYFDTDYEAKADYALRSLNDHDIIIVHVEAPDEAGHLGDFNLKVKTIEDLDSRLVENILRKVKGDYVISIVTDHPTPIEVKTHTRDPVPFAIYSTKENQNNCAKRFDEESVQSCNLQIEATELLQLILTDNL